MVTKGRIIMVDEVDLEDMLKKIVKFNKIFQQIEEEILKTHKMKASAVNLISIIGDERMTLTQITEISGLDKSTVSRQINNLVKDEYVLRESGKDKRYSFFELSKDAKIIYSKYRENFIEYIKDALSAWSEEEKHMFSVLIGRANYSLSTALKQEMKEQ